MPRLLTVLMNFYCFMLQKDHIDSDCVTELSVHYGVTRDEMKGMVGEVRDHFIHLFIEMKKFCFLFELFHLWNACHLSILMSLLLQWKYDYLTATYLLLLNKKLKGRPIRLLSQKALTERQRVCTSHQNLLKFCVTCQILLIYTLQNLRHLVYIHIYMCK